MSHKKIPIHYVKNTRAVKSSIVLPPDTNNHHTMFGGKVMSYIDDIAAISAMRHARKSVVTASTDSVDFLHPILEGHSVCLESFVTWTSKTSMEVFVKVVGEDLLSGERHVCATSFLTFVAVDANGKPSEVTQVIPETEEEKWLHSTAPKRAERRRIRREESKKIAGEIGHLKPWER